MAGHSREGRGSRPVDAKNYPERAVVPVSQSILHILVRVLPVYLAAAALVLFVAGVLRDPRSFSNAVLLGSGLALAALGQGKTLIAGCDKLAHLMFGVIGLIMQAAPIGAFGAIDRKSVV